MIKAVFFDWFNTLAYYSPLREELESQALKELGFNISPKAIIPYLYLADKEYTKENVHLPIRRRKQEEQMRVYANYHRTIMEGIGIRVTDDLAYKVVARMLQLNTTMKFVLYDDALTTIKAVKERKKTVGLLTNVDHGMDAICHELGLASLLDFTITSGEVGSEKPQPPIFLKALELAKIKPEEAIHIGDQYQNDVVGARGVGINPILLDRVNACTEITDCPRITGLAEVMKYL